MAMELKRVDVKMITQMKLSGDEDYLCQYCSKPFVARILYLSRYGKLFICVDNGKEKIGVDDLESMYLIEECKDGI